MVLASQSAKTGMPESLANHRAGACASMLMSAGVKQSLSERLCTKHVELLSVSLHPFYLPREFPQIFVVIVYIHPRANEEEALEAILQVTQKLQSVSHDAPIFVLGDFNHCSLKKTH